MLVSLAAAWFIWIRFLTQQLPLVGGGMHDWTEIFSRWGMLRHDVVIATVTKLLGLGVIILCCCWLWRRGLKPG